MRWLMAAGLVLIVTWAGGCDLVQGERADRERPQLRLLLGSLHHAEINGVSERCATSMHTAVLTVNDQTFTQDVSRDTVVFEVSGLQQGTVRARAAIVSNAGDTLFVGEDRRTIDVADFGTIDITLEKLLPVLQVCPDTVTLAADQDFTETLVVMNRGMQATATQADTLAWTLEGPRICAGPSCVQFEPFSGNVVVPRSDPVFAWSEQPVPNASFDVPFASPHGWAMVHVRIAEE